MTICTLLIQIIREGDGTMKIWLPNERGMTDAFKQEEKRGKWVLAFAMALALMVAVLGMILFLPDKEEGNGIVSSVAAQKDASLSGEQDARISLAPEASSSSRPGDAASSPPEEGAREEMPASSVRITGLPGEVLSLLHCTEGRLAEEMKGFFNANGFADVAEAEYEGETVISHGDCSVSAFFSLERDGDIYEVCCIYRRDAGSRTMDIWE